MCMCACVRVCVRMCIVTRGYRAGGEGRRGHSPPGAPLSGCIKRANQSLVIDAELCNLPVLFCVDVCVDVCVNVCVDVYVMCLVCAQCAQCAQCVPRLRVL